MEGLYIFYYFKTQCLYLMKDKKEHFGLQVDWKTTITLYNLNLKGFLEGEENSSSTKSLARATYIL